MAKSKITAFITKQRLLIILGSLSAAAVLIILSIIVSIDSLAGSLFVNLAASAITIGTTVMLVDYLLSREKELQSREGRGMAQLEAKSLQMQLGTAVNNLYRRYEPKDGGRIPHSNEKDYIEYLYSHLSEEDFKNPHFKFYAKDLTFFETEITTAIGSIEKTITLYSYALSSANRTNLHLLYTQLKAIDSVLSSRRYALLGAKKAKSDLQKLTTSFNEMLGLLLGQLYKISRDRFKIDL